MHDSALYYPYIHFRDPSWLRRAVLSWEQIARIVPQGYEGLDPPHWWASQREDLAVLTGEDVVRDVRPDGGLPAVTKLWATFLAKDGDALAARYRIDERPGSADPERATRGFGFDRSMARDGVAWLLESMMAAPVAEPLRRLGLAVDSGGWIGMDERIVAAYMTSLANELIRDTSIQTITDEARHLLLFGVNSEEALRDVLLADARPKSATDAGTLAMTLAVETVCPKDLDQLPIPVVLDIRRKTDEGRRRFKAGVLGMIEEIREIERGTVGGGVSRKQLDDVRERHLGKPLASLRAQLAGAGWDAATSVVTVQGLAAETVGGTLLGALVGAPWLALTGWAVGLFQIGRQYRKARAELAAEPHAWLLDLEREVASAKDAMERVSAAHGQPRV
jgi:hypothetical protein